MSVYVGALDCSGLCLLETHELWKRKLSGSVSMAGWAQWITLDVVVILEEVHQGTNCVGDLHVSQCKEMCCSG